MMLGAKKLMIFLMAPLLEAIKRVCTHEKAKPEFSEKASPKDKKGKKCPGIKSTARVLMKVRIKEHCSLCKRHGGTYTMHNSGDCCSLRKTERRNPISVPLKKAVRKQNSVNQNFV
jgi:hypothetical protein